MNYVMTGVGWPLLYVAVLAVAAFTVTRRYPGPGAYGLAAIAALPATQLTWFTGLPMWTVAVTSLVTVAAFIIGMKVNKDTRADDWWHLGAAGASLFLKPALGVVVYLDDLAEWLVSADVPVAVLLVLGGLYIMFRYSRGLGWPLRLLRRQGNRNSRRQHRKEQIPSSLANVGF